MENTNATTNMDPLIAKVSSLSILLVVTLIAGLSPLVLANCLHRYSARSPRLRARANYLISLLNCFAGGVFLGTTLLHLFPEVNEAGEDILKQLNYKGEFAFANLVIAGGFFIVMFIEHFVMWCQHGADRHFDEDHPASGGSETAVYNPLPEPTDSTSPIRTGGKSVQKKSYGSLGRSDGSSEALLNVPSSSASTTTTTTTEPSEPAVLPVSEQMSGHASVHVIMPTHHAQHHSAAHVHGMRTLVLLLALSTHMVFEGLAIGLQETAMEVWSLFVAVVIHKVIIAFTMGLSFSHSVPRRRTVIIYMLLFALMSPIGVAVGIGVSMAPTVNQLASAVASGVLQGVATGTFLYVTFFEVLAPEIGQDHGLLKVLVVMLGFIVIALVNFFAAS